MFVTLRLTAGPSIIFLILKLAILSKQNWQVSRLFLNDQSMGRFWTTRLFGEEPTNILNIVETLPGMDAILVYQSGRLAYTSGLHDYCNFNFRKEFP